jgi:hypothetical protein
MYELIVRFLHETLGPSKPFKDLAWGLATRGIAVLRYDKRTKIYGKKIVEEKLRLTKSRSCRYSCDQRYSRMDQKNYFEP